MPAKNIRSVSYEPIFLYIYNAGIDKTIIFNDKEDYDIFTGYIKEYLNPPINRDEIKQEFSVEGKKYFGVPHQPKNYFGKVELISYSLRPNSFHLVLQQITDGAVANFLRSLSTRYVIYFNKKYNRSGALLVSPYKSVQVSGKEITDNYPQYAGYVDTNINTWAKPNIVLSFIDGDKSEVKHEKYLPRGQPNYSRIPHIVASIAVYITLATVGLRNVWISSASTNSPPVETAVMSESPVPKNLLVVKTDRNVSAVKIYRNKDPYSEIVGNSVDGAIYEFTAQWDGWYEIKLIDGSVGYIPSNFTERLEKYEK